MRLPRPARWPERPTNKALAGVAFAAIVGVAGAVWTGVTVARGGYLTATVTLGLAIFMFALVAAVTIGRLGRVSARATLDDGGTTLQVDPKITRLFVAGLAALVVSAVLFVVLRLTGDLDIPLPARGRLFGPAAAAVLGLTAAVGVLRAASMGSLGRVRLTPQGFETATMFSTAGGPWSDVVEVTDASSDGRAYLPIVVVMKDGGAQIIKAANNYTPHGRGLYWMTRHYWLHPEDRAELGDGRAVERLRREQFDVES